MPDSAFTERSIREAATAREASFDLRPKKPANDEAAQQTRQEQHMTKIVYEVVEHDGGWAYRSMGCSRRPSRPTTWPAQPRSAQRRNKSFRETQRAFRTKTRMVVGMTKCRQAMIDPRPTLRAEDARNRRSPLHSLRISPELVFVIRFNSGPIELFQRTYGE